jgi:hypothetical protein
VTDNSAVSWIKKLKNPTGQVARWLQTVETYDITIHHRPGTQHRNADFVSRHLCKICGKQELNGVKTDDEFELNFNNYDDEILPLPTRSSVSDALPSTDTSQTNVRYLNYKQIYNQIPRLLEVSLVKN